MKENTFTFTARSSTEPDKMAMFTLHNGNVSVDLGNTLVEQIGEAYQVNGNEETEENNLAAWIKPAATGAVQKVMKPVPLADFDAEMSDDAFQATAWIRAGGLRLAPVMMTWQDVDNPDGAQAFVTELKDRKASMHDELAHPALLDYWISWILIGVMSIVFSILFIKQWEKQRTT